MQRRCEGPLSADDPRGQHFPRFQGDNLLHNLERVDVLKELATAKGISPAQIAIAWVLSRGDDIVPLVGMSRSSRLPENLATLDIQLSPDELATLDKAFAPGAIVGGRQPTRFKQLAPE